jgi:glyoxylate/hydroxypyruvate reductase A
MSDCIVIKSGYDQFPAWEAAFSSVGIQALRWEHRATCLESIRYALVWHPEPGELAKLPALELVFSIGAGVDHLVGDSLVPGGLPVVRNVDPGLTAGMVEHVVYHVIRFHRRMADYEADQRAGLWRPRLQTASGEHGVGIMGLGTLGGACANAIAALGFRVSGWGRSAREDAQCEYFQGPDGLRAFLGQSEILVCLLPLTPETRGILCGKTLAMLPPESCLINVGRGPLVVESELLEALDRGHLRAAALDVFEQEPLPAGHPFWRHPSVTMTPHVASITLPATSAPHIIANIERHRRGQTLTHLADLERGY